LRILTHKDTKWHWGGQEKAAFQKLKEKLSSEVIAYFEPKKDSKLVVDASPVGLGAVLTQEGKVISYVSKALSDVEKRFSQTEKEALAIVWRIEHFHLYLFGSEFTLITDHKPLEVIFNNPRSRPPARIERWRLRLQPYDFMVQYRSGKGDNADYFSRHPLENGNTFRHSKIAEEYLNFVVSAAKPKDLSLEEVSQASNRDPVLQEVISRMLKGEWKSIPNDSSTQPSARIHDQLTIAPTERGGSLCMKTNW
jgi:hypothetical protein